jgi:integrase/recombinase XerD
MTHLRRILTDYLAVRRSLGFALRTSGPMLEQFVAVVEKQGADHITTELALTWARLPTTARPAHWSRRLSIVRGFARFVQGIDPRTQVPPPGLLPHRYQRQSPHIYAPEEIRLLLDAASRLPSKTGLRAQTYATLLGLLVVTGMRISEAVGLDRDDVDLATGVITIRRTKFKKSRLVPVHASTSRALQQYAVYRDRRHLAPRCGRFFVGERGEPLTVNVVEQTFVKLSHRVGLRAPGDRHGPRLHDFRHRFAVATLIRWYRAGLDVERHLPKLSTYLGHRHVTDTYWYLSAVPELLRLAAARLAGPRGRQRP